MRMKKEYSNRSHIKKGKTLMLYIDTIKKRMKYIGAAGLLITLIVHPVLTFASYDEVEGENDNELEDHNSKATLAITHEEIVSLTGEFMEVILQDVDDDYRVTHYDTKDELLDEFKKLSTREVAEPYIDFYFEENVEGLYIIPTETPPWFNPDNDYDIITSDKSVRIIQMNETDFDGKYTVEYEFKNSASGWKITDIKHL